MKFAIANPDSRVPESSKNITEQTKLNNSPVVHDGVINDFKIEEGVATFTQEKYFSFLSTPIKSSGVLKIKDSNIIWQVNTPVFSKLLIIDNQVWEHSTVITADGSSDIYQKLATHASIETLIQTIFTGKVDAKEWDKKIKNNQCVVLSPINTVLSQAISQLELCHGDIDTKRSILIKDKQNNTTKIFLTQIAANLSNEDVKEFNINP